MTPPSEEAVKRLDSAQPEPWEADAIAAIRAAKLAGGPSAAAAAERAWSVILNAHQDRLYAVCMRMVRDPETARDLTQDTLVKVIQAFDTFDARARLSTWMIRIAMNVCLSHLRKQKLRRHPSLDAPAARRSDGGDAGEGTLGNGLAQTREPTVSLRVEEEETRARLLRALEAIEPDHRAALTLRDVHGLDYQEIADVLDVPVGTVKSRLFRARAALREAIEADQSGSRDEAGAQERRGEGRGNRA